MENCLTFTDKVMTDTPLGITLGTLGLIVSPKMENLISQERVNIISRNHCHTVFCFMVI